VIEKVLAEYAAATATMASKTDVVTTRRVQLDAVVGRGDLPQKQRAEKDVVNVCQSTGKTKVLRLRSHFAPKTAPSHRVLKRVSVSAHVNSVNLARLSTAKSSWGFEMALSGQAGVILTCQCRERFCEQRSST
jgi:hypothetical protein